MTEKTRKRLLALDVMRGITIAGMLLVNNPGSWSNIYTPLRHASWNGLTPTDLVFPFFMFIMGMSTWFSLKSFNFELNGRSAWKIIRRSIVIFLIAMALILFGRILRGAVNGNPFLDAFNFDNIRLLGVLPRLAICYCIGSFCALLIRGRALWWTVAAFLAVYTVIIIFGNGYEFSENNVIYIVDNAILGPNHLYSDTIDGVTLKLDPEGLLSTLPSIAHMLIGYICAGLIMQIKDNRERINRLFIIGTIMTFCGLLLSYGLPINKKIWSPTFVFTTCGMASLLLGLLIWIIDMRGKRRWCRFFEVFGINPLFLFCIGTVIAIVLGSIRISFDGDTISLGGWFYRGILIPLFGDPVFASLIYAILFVLINWLMGLVLYKKKIYIKI